MPWHPQVKWLINDAKADTSIQTQSGSSAAYIARRGGHDAIVELLGEKVDDKTHVSPSGGKAPGAPPGNASAVAALEEKAEPDWL